LGFPGPKDKAQAQKKQAAGKEFPPKKKDVQQNKSLINPFYCKMNLFCPRSGGLTGNKFRITRLVLSNIPVELFPKTKILEGPPYWIIFAFYGQNTRKNAYRDCFLPLALSSCSG
jgi:hypothetical protein